MEHRICPKCNNNLPISQFKLVGRPRKDGTRGTMEHCRICWYKTRIILSPEEKLVTPRSRYVNRRRNEIARLMYNYLKEHPCIDCGESDVLVLEFDHRDPSQKVSDVCDLLSRIRVDGSILEEVEKCDVRCANCHRRKTAREANWLKYQIQQEEINNAEN